MNARYRKEPPRFKSTGVYIHRGGAELADLSLARRPGHVNIAVHKEALTMDVWGRLAPRFAGSEDRPHRLLALDGGGIRGVMTLEVLVRIEELLEEKLGMGDDFRLCQFFDYVAGTSTGAIIAAGLARGMSAEELLEFYQTTGPAMFSKPPWYRRLVSFYDPKPLKKALQETFNDGDRVTMLYPRDLECLLLAVTRNVSTDSPWPISSNPRAKYNDQTRDDCNLAIPLWQIVRASTAAPVYFPPEEISLGSYSYVFVDGGMTPYNNPAFLLYRMATDPAYRLEWARGEDKLLLVSIGTGTAETLAEDAAGRNIIASVKDVPNALMLGSLVDQDINCRAVGRCTWGERIDSELGDMIPREEDDEGNERPVPLGRDLGRAFLYARYNADLGPKGLEKLGLPDVDPAKVQSLDSVDAIDDLRRVGRAVAEAVSVEHFGSFVDSFETG